MRSFLTRFPNSLIGVVLLIPCLLICLSCATPFPVENLEEGMTPEAVLERFGEPRTMEANPVGSDSYWTYANRELEVGAVILGWPWAPLFVAVSWLPNFEWDDPYMSSSEVMLRFEGEKLARWDVSHPAVGTPSGHNPAAITTDPFHQGDWGHHELGHSHHHGHK